MPEIVPPSSSLLLRRTTAEYPGLTAASVPLRPPAPPRTTRTHTATLPTQTMPSITLLSQFSQMKAYTLLRGSHTNATPAGQLLSNPGGRVMRGAGRGGAERGG